MEIALCKTFKGKRSKNAALSTCAIAWEATLAQQLFVEYIQKIHRRKRTPIPLQREFSIFNIVGILISHRDFGSTWNFINVKELEARESKTEEIRVSQCKELRILALCIKYNFDDKAFKTDLRKIAKALKNVCEREKNSHDRHRERTCNALTFGMGNVYRIN